MAQTPNSPDQEAAHQDQQQPQRSVNQQQLSSDTTLNFATKTTTQRPPSKALINTNRASFRKQHSNQLPGDSSISSNTPSPNLLNLKSIQSSKIFLAKCRAELEALLVAIKQTYHEEIKTLYSEGPHADFFIQFSQEEFKKPLHRCIIAARVFKLYKSLKAFKLIEVPIEEDIIVSKLQEKLSIEQANLDKTFEFENQNEEQKTIEEDQTENLTNSEEYEDEAKEVEDEPILHCDIPHDLISPELFLNFVRRVYLDQDISEEETELNKRLINWLKENKPELIKVPKRNTLDHRESFRTIIPDFDETIVPALTRSSNSPRSTMSPGQLINLDDDDANTVDETSQSTSMREVSLTGSLLTRTETFELLTKTSSDSKTKNDPNDERESETSADSSNVDTPEQPPIEAYAPTTRTGLKPRTFTTPVGLRSSNRDATGPTSKPTPTKRPEDPRGKSSTAKTTSTRAVGASPKKSESTESPSTASKTTISGPQTRTPKTSITPTTKSKTTVITRAHPISMERSQSPGTRLIKPARNFIAANKRLISQIEKKNPPSHHNDSSASNAGDSTTETDSNLEPLFILDSLTSDNLVAQMDKFSLMSQSKLADSLSRMFVDGILTDTSIRVREENKQILAHKCILAARSAYLAEAIEKQSLPQAISSAVPSNEPIKIDLTEFSYSAVYFALLHIYSGIVKVPQDLDIEELAKLTHHLHVSTLTQVSLQNLRMNYCHFFHKPCNVCCVGVLRTLPLAWRYDYTELYTRCLQWIGSNFASIYCLKEFSELNPHDLLEECYSATLSQLSADNIIPKTIECQKLLKNLPRVKWTESIICMVGRLLEDFCHYVADNYEKILQSESFMNLGKNCWECEVLEENLLAAMNHLKPDSGCKTLIQLDKIECSLESYCDDPRNASDSFVKLVSKMRKYCERYLLKEATAVVHCNSWRHMSPSLQKRIKDQAILATDFDEPTKQLASKPRLPSTSRTINESPSSGWSENKSPRSTPDMKLKSPSTAYLLTPKNKTAPTRHVKVLK